MIDKFLGIEADTVINNNASKYIQQVIKSGKTSGDGYYTQRCQSWLEGAINSKKILMTTSCTHALELVFQLLGLEEYEVIMPSYNFPSSANAVLINGGKVVFTQVNNADLCIDVDKIEEKITSKTRAILVVHYGGMSCQMDEIMDIAKRYNLYVIEDAAQGFLSTYKGKYLGTIGHFGCFSFHETKNISCGEGGALSINISDPTLSNKAEIIRQKGTNRKAFENGLVSQYEWVNEGSSYSPSELLMAYLYSQLELANQIQDSRMKIFNQYKYHFQKVDYRCIENYSKDNPYGDSNGHIFYIIFKYEQQAQQFVSQLAKENIKAITHFVPLHLSEMGARMGYHEEDFPFEASVYKRLIRLPIDTQSDETMVTDIINKIHTIIKGL